MNQPIIQLRDVNVSFDGKKTLKDVNLDLFKGDFLAISGPNGGGKTTLLRVMLKLLRPTSGSVAYLRDGHPTKTLKIGYLPQKSMIDTKFPITVKEAVMSGLQRGLFGRLPGDADERFDEVTVVCGIHKLLDHTVGVLSGGQLQRTLMARAIISKPEVLMLDEPLSYVDKRFEQQIYSILEEIREKTTIVLVSHEMSVIGGMANRQISVNQTINNK